MMNKQLLFLSLVAAVLFAGCSKNESDSQVIDPTAPAIQISAKSSTRGSIDTKAPVTGTSLDGNTADVYALDGKISGQGTATGALSSCYGSGTMTFDDSKYVGFDEGSLSGLNGGQSLLPQNPTAPLYLYGFYPQGWTIDTPGAIESLSKVFDGSTDLMSSYLSDADDVQIEYGKPNDKGDLVFKHLLTRYNIQVKANDAEALTAWGSVKSVVIKDAATANNAVSFNSNGISYKHIGATSAPVFFKLSGTTAVPTYSDDKFEAADFATSQALTTIFANGCYSMLAPVDVDVDKTTPEITLEVVTLDKVGGVDKKTEVKVSLDQSKFGSAPFSTRGYSVTITLNFRAGAIQAIASVERWKDYGIQYDDVEFPKLPTNPPASTDYVEIYGLKWAKGNLVAKNSNECKVGAPADYGVYFQFGSLVGWTGGANGNGTGQGEPATVDKAVWPSAMGYPKPSYAWPSKDVAGTSTLSDYYFNYSVAPWATDGQNIRDFAVAIPGDSGSGTLADGRYAKLGVGDPCTYYLGAPWRLPTTTELASITGKTGASQIAWTTSGLTGRWVTSADSFDGVSGPGAWFGSPLSAGTGTPKVSVNPFFPASGTRHNSDGSFYHVTEVGGGWSSSVGSATKGLDLSFYDTWVFPQVISDRSFGFSARCVSPLPTNPPAASDIVTIADLRWTKGNLVAKNTNECKVGAPADYGLYFQFGSLVGWQGGATGDGTGVTNTGLGVTVQVKPLTYVGTDVWATVGRYLGGTMGGTGYGLPSTDTPTAGVGDPCRFYLGAPWRTPTAAEIITTFANVNDNTAWGSVPGWNWQATPAGAIGPSSLFFPASGVRGSFDGSFNNVTTYGYGWSSSVFEAMLGLTLSFSSSLVSPQLNSMRSNGFPVRCVSSVP